MNVRELRSSLIFFKIVRAIKILDNSKSSSSCFWVAQKDVNSNVAVSAFLKVIIFDMLYNWTEQLILLEYLISYICHVTLSLFADDSDFRKIEKLEEKADRRQCVFRSWVLLELLRVCTVVDIIILLTRGVGHQISSRNDEDRAHNVNRKEKVDKEFKLSFFSEIRKRIWRTNHKKTSQELFWAIETDTFDERIFQFRWEYLLSYYWLLMSFQDPGSRIMSGSFENDLDLLLLAIILYR